MTLSEKAIAALKAAGIDARKPANYVGECKAPYVVVQDGGDQPGGKTTCKRVVTLYAYVPYNQPAKLPTLLANARNVMRQVRALRLSATGEEGIDNEYKANTASLTYTALCAR